MPDDALAKRVQAIGTMSSYSVYQLSEGTEHKAFVECESEEGLLLLDPSGDAFNANGDPISRGSYMTGRSRGMTGINEDDFEFEEGKSYD